MPVLRLLPLMCILFVVMLLRRGVAIDGRGEGASGNKAPGREGMARACSWLPAEAAELCARKVETLRQMSNRWWSSGQSCIQKSLIQLKSTHAVVREWVAAGNLKRDWLKEVVSAGQQRLSDLVQTYSMMVYALSGGAELVVLEHTSCVIGESAADAGLAMLAALESADPSTGLYNFKWFSHNDTAVQLLFSECELVRSAHISPEGSGLRLQGKVLFPFNDFALDDLRIAMHSAFGGTSPPALFSVFQTVWSRRGPGAFVVRLFLQWPVELFLRLCRILVTVSYPVLVAIDYWTSNVDGAARGAVVIVGVVLLFFRFILVLVDVIYWFWRALLWPVSQTPRKQTAPHKSEAGSSARAVSSKSVADPSENLNSTSVEDEHREGTEAQVAKKEDPQLTESQEPYRDGSEPSPANDSVGVTSDNSASPAHNNSDGLIRRTHQHKTRGNGKSIQKMKWASLQ